MNILGKAQIDIFLLTEDGQKAMEHARELRRLASAYNLPKETTIEGVSVFGIDSLTESRVEARRRGWLEGKRDVMESIERELEGY